MNYNMHTPKVRSYAMLYVYGIILSVIWVYLEPNKNFYVSPSNFFNAWILGGGVDCGFKGLEALECELWIILQWFTIAWESQDQK